MPKKRTLVRKKSRAVAVRRCFPPVVTAAAAGQSQRCGPVDASHCLVRKAADTRSTSAARLIIRTTPSSRWSPIRERHRLVRRSAPSSTVRARATCNRNAYPQRTESQRAVGVPDSCASPLIGAKSAEFRAAGVRCLVFWHALPRPPLAVVSTRCVRTQHRPCWPLLTVVGVVDQSSRYEFLCNSLSFLCLFL